jgi:hypothetical protein
VASALLVMPAAAEDFRLDHQMAADGDLIAALDAGDAQATAFIAGALSGYFIRSAQGDPLLWWVQQCLAMTYAGPNELVPGIREVVEARPDDARIAEYAGNAVLSALASYCAEHVDFAEITPAE